MNRWKVVDNGTFSGLEADFQPVCHYCLTPMESSCIKLVHFPLNEPAYWLKGQRNGRAIDCECECPRCGYWETFGVAVSKEHWNKVNERATEEEGESQIQYDKR